jgi:hypothetical protein
MTSIPGPARPRATFVALWLAGGFCLSFGYAAVAAGLHSYLHLRWHLCALSAELLAGLTLWRVGRRSPWYAVAAVIGAGLAYAAVIGVLIYTFSHSAATF